MSIAVAIATQSVAIGLQAFAVTAFIISIAVIAKVIG